MKNKIALLTSSQGKNTQKVGMILSEMLADDFKIDQIDIDQSDGIGIKDYPFLIMGASTWFDGELPYYWDEFLPSIEDCDFSDTKVAIFGLGDSKRYPDNFCDAIGLLAKWFEKHGATIIGSVHIDDYHFETAFYTDDHRFKGLPVEYLVDNTEWEERIANWKQQIVEEFNEL
ncbi:flavodoxin domain-containing protein [Halosquirtibacter laminarini]|uniref:Flavodoxin domain-containing protein n=1 Tax=Halosquirtibacter laminarini TaxID=3374600 RepID=A0AC61NQ05_9BACT|nr:flavodoxin domain-containing protein [Prolixibacteraceae bacterium]